MGRVCCAVSGGWRGEHIGKCGGKNREAWLVREGFSEEAND